MPYKNPEDKKKHRARYDHLYRAREEVKKQKHNWYMENKEQELARKKLWYQKNKEKMRVDRNIKLYGVDKDRETFIIESQNYECICGRKLNEVWTHIDHCHKTGKVRGILCSECNTGLGKFKDSIELLQKAIEYLKRNQ